MGRDHNPVPGQWYESLDDEEVFQVLSIDEDAELIELQYEDGDVEEIDYETWQELDLDLTEEPEGWSGPDDEEEDDEELDEDEDDDDWDDEDDEDDDDEDEDATATATTTRAGLPGAPEPGRRPPVQAAGPARNRPMNTFRLIAPACLLVAGCVSSGPESQLGKEDKATEAHRDVPHQRLRLPVDRSTTSTRSTTVMSSSTRRAGARPTSPRSQAAVSTWTARRARRRRRRPQRPDLRLRPRLDRLPAARHGRGLPDPRHGAALGRAPPRARPRRAAAQAAQGKESEDAPEESPASLEPRQPASMCG